MSSSVDAVFAALGDPTRRGVLEAVAASGPITATQLAGTMPISRQAVAKHLAVLGRAGLVEPRRAGRETQYRATPEQLGEAQRWMDAVGSTWDRRLAALDTHLRKRQG